LNISNFDLSVSLWRAPRGKFSSTFFKRWRSQGRGALVAAHGEISCGASLFGSFSLAPLFPREKERETKTNYYKA
jgi:hypothetical protein